MVERTTPGPVIDVIDLDNYSYRAPQGCFLTIEEDPGDSADEADVRVVYEIESDKDSAADVAKARRRRRRPVVETESEESDYSSPKRRMIADSTQKRHYLRNKTVKVVPSEVWLKILSFSHPAFLARARRISRTFKTLIDDEKVWRCARLCHFPEYPGPAFDLKESEMWNLYLGTGCMVCHAPKIKNRYWRFRIRCCVDCLGKATVGEHEVGRRQGFKLRWAKYLFPSVLRYGKWRNWSAGCGLKTYCLEDVKVLERAMRPPVSTETVLMAQMDKVRKDIEIMEIFEEKLSGQRYFEIRERIARLDPPFTDDILSHIPAYGSAIKIQRPLTDRSWSILLKKLEAGRSAAAIEAASAEQERLRVFGRPFWEMKAALAGPGKPSPKEMGARMAKVFSGMQLFHMLPGTHRLFLWFRLCVAMHAREYNQVPDIRAFAAAADSVRDSSGKPPFKGLLGCGICSAYQSKKKKKPWPWVGLSQHFDAHNSFKKRWPEKLLVLPPTADMVESCSRIEDKVVRRRWIGLFKVADEELGGMLDDRLRLEEEEDAARSGAVRDEQVCGVLDGPATHLQSQKRRREADLPRIPDGGGDDKEKRLKVGTGGYKNVPVPSFSGVPAWETPTSTTPLAGARETAVKHVEIPAKPAAALPMKPPPEAAARSVKILPRKPPPDRETRAPEVVARPAKVPSRKPVETPPARARENRASEVVNVLPKKPPAGFPERAREARVPEVVARSVKITGPPATPAMARENRVPEVIATSINVLPRKLPAAPPERARENRVPEVIAASIKVFPREPPPVRDTRAPEVIAGSVKITKPPTVPQAPEVIAASIKVLPREPPPARETRPPKTAAKPAEAPPAREPPAREKTPDPKPDEPPAIENRNRSASVDVDIEALFADA